MGDSTQAQDGQQQRDHSDPEHELTRLDLDLRPARATERGAVDASVPQDVLDRLAEVQRLPFDAQAFLASPGGRAGPCR